MRVEDLRPAAVACLVGAVFASLGACSAAPAPETNLTGHAADACQPLIDETECFLPFPSDYFRTPDPQMASGYRVRLPDPAVVRDKADRSTDMTAWRPIDGASLTPMIVGRLGNAFSAANLVNLVDDPAPTVRGTSPILLIEAETGRLVAHYEDIDPDVTAPAEQLFIVSPLERLRPSTRYVVLVRGLVDDRGTPVEAAAGFRMLRDRAATRDRAVGPLAERFEREVFPVAERAGVPRASLQLAWSFTTASVGQAIGDVERAYSLATEALGGEPATVRVSRVDEPTSGTWGRKVYGTIEVPSVLTGTGDRWALLARDDEGRVKLNGRLDLPFRALVPRSVLEATGSARSLVFGHGFFGGADEAEDAACARIADRTGSVVFAVDWLGMSRDDIESLTDRITRQPAMLPAFAERTTQGIINVPLLRRAIGSGLAALPELRRTGEAGPMFDATRVSYFGISQGHVLGGAAMALDPGFDRAALHVGGGGMGQLMLRSQNFGLLLALIGTRVSDPLPRRRMIALAVAFLDRIDPAAYAERFRVQLRRGEAGMPVLMQAGLGDANVPHFAAIHHARALGLPLARNAPLAAYGMAEADLGTVTSALQLFDRGWNPATYRPCAPVRPTSPVHEALRHDAQAVSQLTRFLTTGALEVVR